MNTVLKKSFIARCLTTILCALPVLAWASVVDHFEKIKSSPNALYAFLKAMPKGGELHYHLAGGAYPEAMLEVAAKGDYCLTQDNVVLKQDKASCTGLAVNELALHPDKYIETIRSWSLKDFTPGPETGHDHFFAAFYKFLAIVANEQVPLLADVIQRAANQHEQYMEIMILPDNAKSSTLIKEAKAPLDYDVLRKHLLETPAFKQEVENTVTIANHLLPDTRQWMGCQLHPADAACEVEVRFQYYILREQPLKNFFAQALHAFEAASHSSALVGINVVQAEDGYISLRDYRLQMAILDYLHKIYPKVHIDLHAGELASGNIRPEDLRFHIHDAVKVGHAERIGHGVDIAHENEADALADDMAARGIPVEINLVSNAKILLVSGSMHPLKYYLSHHVPVVLSTDDEGILRTDLTEQYVLAVTDHGIDYPTLKQINRNALSYAFIPGNSIWQDNNKSVPISACKDLNSKSCDLYVKNSEKATLQRALELKLTAFEKTF